MNFTNFIEELRNLDPKTPGISFLDISTGEFYLAQGTIEYIDKLIQTFRPSEVIIQKNKRQEFTELFGSKFYISTFDDWVFTSDFSNDLLLKHFGTASLKGFGVENLDMGVIAAGAALHYLAETQHDKVQHNLKFYADTLFITPKYLIHAIKNASGKSPGKLIDEAIVEEAKLLLKETNLSIASVAEELHFSDQASFSKFFKKHTGLSPLSYRRE